MANLINIQYGCKSYQLPKSLVTNEEFVKEIVSANVWNNKLRKSDKMNLLKFLPDFSNNDTFEKKETLKKLFLGKHINFENQIKRFVRLVKEGDFNVSLKPQKGLDLLLGERNRKISLLKRRLNDLQNIIDKKKSLSMEISEEEENCMKEFQHYLTRDDPLCDVVDSRFDGIMSKITSDSDQFKKCQLYAEYFANESLDFRSLSLADVINRCQNETDVAPEEPVAVHNGPMTRKRRLLQNGGESNVNNKYAKFNESSDSQSDSSDPDIQRSNDDNSDDSVTSDTDSVGSAIVATGANHNHHKRVRLNRHERREFRCPQDDFTDYFCLLQRLLVGAHQQKLTTHQIEDRIRHWYIVNKRNIADGFNRWALLGVDWVSAAVPALTFLAGQAHDGVTIVEQQRKRSPIVWRWRRELDQDILHQLCVEWQHQFGPNGVRVSGGPNGGTTGAPEGDQIPPPLYPTEWRVKPSTPEEKLKFQMQERKRFLRPWRAFLYNVHGYNCAVAPVRGCLPGRDYSNVKARGHPLLVNERPPHVNIVEIVRDAVARLPNGEGSRADIVTLAMDSAFWSGGGGPAGPDKSISQCISSALDRLQGEGIDPSVKYNARLKLWFYRHRNKSLDELEQLHQHDDARRYRAAASSTAGSSSNGPMRPSGSSAIQQHHLGVSPLLYNHQMIPPAARFGQTYQQFSQAVNHARDLTLQPVFLSARQPPAPSGLYHQPNMVPGNHPMFPSGGSVNIARSISSTQQDLFHSQHQSQQYQQHYYY